MQKAKKYLEWIEWDLYHIQWSPNTALSKLWIDHYINQYFIDLNEYLRVIKCQ